ncbi:hypothetical protein WSM22_42630 [Cytophagales bacterium WSM2-2]|nr:hypothetical protein WSM22_42630 [Cytophagales bacterium WSM2-2]
MEVSQQALILSGFADVSTDYDRKEYFDFNFKIKDLDGSEVDFRKFKGKIVFLNLWATWCGPCRAEMPTIQKLYEGADKEKIEFVILSLDEDALLKRVKNFKSNNEYTFPVYMSSGYLPDQLQVPSIPTTFVIDQNGLVTLKEVGMKNYNTPRFKKFLEGLSAKN